MIHTYLGKPFVTETDYLSRIRKSESSNRVTNERVPPTEDCGNGPEEFGNDR